MRFLCGIYDWLAVSDTPRPSDVIFVLAGRECRKVAGLKLYRDGLAGRLLLSVGRFEIRRFSKHNRPVALALIAAAASIAPAKRHFFVAVEPGESTIERVRLCRLGTWSEVQAFSEWLQMRPQIKSATVISSGFHLRRVRMCCRFLISGPVELRFLDVQEGIAGLDRNHWWRNPFARRLVVLELFKLALYWLICHRPRLRVGWKLMSGRWA